MQKLDKPGKHPAQYELFFCKSTGIKQTLQFQKLMQTTKPNSNTLKISRKYWLINNDPT